MGCPEIPTGFTTSGDKGTAGKSEAYKVDREINRVSIRQEAILLLIGQDK